MKKLIKHVVYDTDNRESWTLLAEAKDWQTKSETYLYRVSVPERHKDIYLEYKIFSKMEEYLVKLSGKELDSIINFWANPVIGSDIHIESNIYWDNFVHYS